jgi:hypothetical protein
LRAMDAAHHLILLTGALGLRASWPVGSRLALAHHCCSCSSRSESCSARTDRLASCSTISKRHVGTAEHRSVPAVGHFFETLGWLAQIVLFLMLGLLVTPHMILGWRLPHQCDAAFGHTADRPALPACYRSASPCARQRSCRGGVEGRLCRYTSSIIPMVAGITDANFLFEPTFMVVVISLVYRVADNCPGCPAARVPRASRTTERKPEPRPLAGPSCDVAGVRQHCPRIKRIVQLAVTRPLGGASGRPVADEHLARTRSGTRW